MAYYLDLFSPETFEAFIKSDQQSLAFGHVSATLQLRYNPVMSSFAT
jgi:hypothetical protein